MLRLVLVRHGQTDANLRRVLQGQSDGALNATGRQQAEELGRCLKDVPLDEIIASPLRRAQDTARAIGRYHPLPVRTSSLIVEWNCGLLDGVSADVFRKSLQESGLPVSSFQPDGGETLLDVQQRARLFLSELTSPDSERTVLVCSHGDFLRALMSLLLQVGLEEAAGIHLDNGSFTILERQEGCWKLVALNRLPESMTDLPPSFSRG